MSYRAGFAGIIGLPNSGKSTLLNLLVGEKVSIVTAKPQTTRRRMIGIYSSEKMQAILVDAPGVVKAQSGLNLFLREEALDVISQSDVLIAVLNIDEGQPEKLHEIIDLVKDSGKPWFAVINKTDLHQLHRSRILREKVEALGVPVISGSSLNGGEALKEQVLATLEQLLPVADKPLYESDLYTLSSVRDLCSEIIREKCFENLHQEVPFHLAVKMLRFVEDDGPLVRIEAELVTGKENHKPIVVGRGGQVLKKIGTEARKEIEKLVGRRVFLDLKVTSRPNWQRNSGSMKELGYVHLQS